MKSRPEQSGRSETGRLRSQPLHPQARSAQQPLEAGPWQSARLRNQLHFDRDDPRAMIVARKIIEHARHGKRDPIRLREAVLAEVRAAADAG
jgi:hypothetical protein